MKNIYEEIINLLKKYHIDSHKSRKDFMDLYDKELLNVFKDGLNKGYKRGKKCK
jgi:hypothetical protein